MSSTCAAPGAEVDGRKRRTPGQIVAGGIAGAVIGLGGGAAFAADLPGMATSLGASAGGLVMGLVSAWADATRRPGRPQPLWVRVLASAFLAATVGWLLGRLLPDWPAPVVGAIVGLGAGSMGARVGKAGLGLASGILVGLAASLFDPEPGGGLVAAATVTVYRLAAALIYRRREQIRFRAEDADPGTVPYVVPLVEKQGYVGVDYLRRHADEIGGAFARNPTDIGIVDSIDRLAGPSFDPARVDPLIREFYEHTSRFDLEIVPRWRPWMRLPYLAYREMFARPLGQANAPFQIEEVGGGVVSWIDTIDVDGDGRPDFRAWVRAYAGTLEPLYVGIYTTFRADDTGYVSVGFPLPTGSFTATLHPSHRGDGDLLLTSRHLDPRVGHYLSLVDPDTGHVSVAELTTFHEEIHVYLRDGRLLTDHRFFLGRTEFMSLHYTISRR
ncbi:MAG TPA: hypothetical protein VK088_02520 [Acidimicrobiia bacterium]|nr:hypothetical protein [Acidimicrobiia bacterium]